MHYVKHFSDSSCGGLQVEKLRQQRGTQEHAVNSVEITRQFVKETKRGWRLGNGRIRFSLWWSKCESMLIGSFEERLLICAVENNSGASFGNTHLRDTVGKEPDQAH